MNFYLDPNVKLLSLEGSPVSIGGYVKPFKSTYYNPPVKKGNSLEKKLFWLEMTAAMCFGTSYGLFMHVLNGICK